MEFKNQDNLRPDTKDKIVAYASQLQTALGENLLSIIVYGSVLKENFISGKSNINLLLILKQIDVATLKSCLDLVKNGQKNGFIAPLMLTPQHIISSLDVFPIEFSEIHDNHLAIYGDGLPPEIATIDKNHLRLQCEREIKGKLIHLRQGYLETTLRGNSLKLLLEDSMRAILPLMRAVLRICCKQSPPVEGNQVITTLCNEFPLDQETFQRVLKLKTDNIRPPQTELETLLSKYLIQLQKLAQLVDQMQVDNVHK